MTEQCATCNPVTQEQCQQHRDTFQCSLDTQDKRITENELQTAHDRGVMEVQTKLLWGIFGFVGANFFVNLFVDMGKLFTSVITK